MALRVRARYDAALKLHLQDANVVRDALNKTVHIKTLFLFAFFSACVVAEEKLPAMRKFADGPLRIEEFQGKPDRTQFGDAYTANRVEFKYEFNFEEENGDVMAQLKSFEAFSVFLPQVSWWKSTARDFLLDHEQGHFDIAEATARRIQLGFEKVLADQKRIRARGATKKEAAEKLTAKLSRVMKVANDRANQDNEEYDSITSHGMRRRIQAEQRHVQKATLDRLAAELKVARKRREKLKQQK